MPDPKETVYDAEPHTRAKHQILREYLKRWLPILAHQSRNIGRTDSRLLYVDGFAGAGEYTDKSPGSPVVAIETALEHSHAFPVPVQIKMIENRSDRVKHLRSLLSEKRLQFAQSRKIIVDDPIQGDCEQVTEEIITQHEQIGKRLGPALFFLDQYGYSSFSMGLVSRILKHEVCEVFSYLNWNLLHPFMSDQTKHAGIIKAFGGDEWKEVIDLSGNKREEKFREIYLQALRQRAGARYAYPFAMRGHDNRVIYWLFFCSNNLRGLEAMKQAMWTVDRSGGFQFSDKHADQLGPLFEYNDTALANDLVTAFDGQTISVGAIREYVLVETPSYKYKSALGILERDGRLEVIDPPQGRRKGSFSDESMNVRLMKEQTSGDRMLF